MPQLLREFGFYPCPLHLVVGQIAIQPLSDFEAIVEKASHWSDVENGWVYAPRQQVRGFNDEIRTMPYSSRVFGLPKTHTIEHAAIDNEDQLAHHLWVLSFLTGMRLTATDAGFLDATPLRPGMLVDFVVSPMGLEHGLKLSEEFWVNNRADPNRARLFAAVVHALFLAQNPQLLQVERFLFLYTALDACFALAGTLYPLAPRVPHTVRIDITCKLFNMATPHWADPAAVSQPEVAALRNNTIHEGLFMGHPLGFAIHGVGTNQNLTLEMEALVCRLLVALLGATHADYVRSPVTNRQTHGLEL